MLFSSITTLLFATYSVGVSAKSPQDSGNYQQWLKTQTFDLGLYTPETVSSTLSTSTTTGAAEWNYDEWLKTQTFDLGLYTTPESLQHRLKEAKSTQTLSSTSIPAKHTTIQQVDEKLHLGHCKDGQLKCTFDAKLAKCDHGKWISFACAAGTKCSTTFEAGQKITGCNART